MKIVDRKTFLTLPSGTVYQKYEPCFFGPIEIKGDTCGADWWAICQPDFPEAVDSGAWEDCCTAMEAGEERHQTFDVSARDGLFDEGQLFGVWSQADVLGFIEALKPAANGE